MGIYPTLRFTDLFEMSYKDGIIIPTEFVINFERSRMEINPTFLRSTPERIAEVFGFSVGSCEMFTFTNTFKNLILCE